MVKLELTKDEAEVLETYLFRKCAKLEESGLTDSRCYVALSSIRHKLRQNNESK